LAGHKHITNIRNATGSRCDVAEIDPSVVEACHQAMGLPRDTPIRTMLNDARVVVDRMSPDRRCDLIIGDAFSDLAVPWHLTTIEFQQKLRDHLADGGVVLTNIIKDFHAGGRFLVREDSGLTAQCFLEEGRGDSPSRIPVYGACLF
jgi:spermidine synthase